MSGKRKNRKSGKSGKQSKLSRVLSLSNCGGVRRGKYFNRFSAAAARIRVQHAYFSELTPDEVRKNVSKVASNPHFSQAIDLTLKPGAVVYKDLMPSASLPVIVNWAIGILLHHKEKLQAFTTLESKITVAILEEDCDSVITFLDEVDALCGLSTWSLSVRGAMLRSVGKQDKLKEYLEELYQQHKESDLFKAISNQVMNRYDDSTTFKSSSIGFRKQIQRAFDGEFQSFLMYKIVSADFSSGYAYNFHHILNYEKDASLVDLFKGVVGFAFDSVVSEDYESRNLALLAVKELSKQIPYYLLEGLSVYIEGSAPRVSGESPYRLLDLYNAGCYEEVCTGAIGLEPQDMSFSTFEIVTLSAARTGSNPFIGLKGDVLQHLVDVLLLHPEKYERSMSHLLALCHAFSGIPWFNELHYLISREAGGLDEKSRTLLKVMSSLYSRESFPRKIQTLPLGARQSYLAACSNSVPNSLSVRLFSAIENSHIDHMEKDALKGIDEKRFLKYKAKALVKSGDNVAATEILKQLADSDDKLIAYEAMRLLVDSYVALGFPENAIEVFVRAAVSNPIVTLKFDTFKICEIAKGIINEFKSINVPIALSLHSRLVDGTYDHVLRYSFDKYLQNIGVSSPSQFFEALNSVEMIQRVYFLEHVCVRDVVKLSLMFLDRVEIENFRIGVCNYLIKLEGSKDYLIDEVKEITRDQVIRDAVTHVHQSRINADLSGFKDGRSQAFRSVFDRYLELNQKDYSEFDDERDLSKVHKAIMKDKAIAEKAHSVHVLELTLNEKNQAFMQLLKMLRDEFTFGDKGLNRYLSTRIRHGVFPDAFRSCVQSEGLVTTLSSGSPKPNPNILWREKLSDLRNEDWRMIEDALAKFTIEYERTITGVNDGWLQIVSLDQDIQNMQKGGAKDSALFNYSISNVEAFGLQMSMDGDYDTFIKIISQWLWGRTEQNLIVVREKISGELRSRFSECYDSLLKSISLVDNTQLLRDSIVRSREALHTALETVLSWFTRSNVNLVRDFEMRTAIEIAARTANVTIHKSGLMSDIRFDGEHLNSFVDVLYILFENAATKSQVDRNDLELSVELADAENECLRLAVTNKCCLNGDFTVENSRLDYYRDNYGNEELTAGLIQSEKGGTGFFRIWKILAKDVEVLHEANFGYNKNDVFSVEIIMEQSTGVQINENIID